MNLISKEREKHLAEIIHLLSMYHALTLSQFMKLFPELPKEKLFALIHRLEKSGRLAYHTDSETLLFSKECEPVPATISSFWVLLDFKQDVTYHTVSEFPVALTFYTQSDAYDVIYVPEDKEILINHALSEYQEAAPRRLVIVNYPEQITQVNFPGITAFCTVSENGQVQYYKKQGVTDS